MGNASVSVEVRGRRMLRTPARPPLRGRGANLVQELQSAQVMNPIALIYATREGQTRKIAGHIAEILHTRGIATRLVDAKELAEPFSLADCSAAILLASVHGGRHEHEMIVFTKRHRTELQSLSTAFLSVSLSEVGVEDAARTPSQRAEFAADVDKMVDDFLAATGWHPGTIFPVAGALMYSKYGAFVRFVMKRIAQMAGVSTDTSRDHEFTNWTALDYFISTFLDSLRSAASEGVASVQQQPAQ